MITPVQHISDSNPTLSTRRTFSDLQFRLFYSGNTSSYCFGGTTLSPIPGPTCPPGATLSFPALAAPPTISGIDTSFDTSTHKLTFRAQVIGDPVAGIHEAWVTWTIPAGAAGSWQSFNLVQDSADASLWTGSLTLGAGDDPGQVRFMVQAASGIGRVMLDNNHGAFYRPGSIPGATPPLPPVETSLLLDPTPASVKYGEQFPVTIALKQGGSGARRQARPHRPRRGRPPGRHGSRRKGDGDTPRRRDAGELPNNGHVRR